MTMHPASVTGTLSVLDFGAARDGSASATDAFAAAIQAAARLGGGTVYVPPGRYVTGSIVLRSHVHLFLDAGAIILGSSDPSEYPITSTRWEGLDVEAHAGLITGAGLEHIAITGFGTIDGCGGPWWEWHRQRRLGHPRPRLIDFRRCRHVRIQGVTLRNSPAWTINPTFCEDVLVDGVTIINPPESPNTDGINPDSCRNVRINNCYIDVGDDCVTIKAGKEGRSTSGPCENIVVSNCTMVRGHGGVVIGSEMSGGVRNIVISNCVFEGTDRGIRIKTRRGRGGVVEDVRVSNVVMRGVSCPFTINAYYRCGVDAASAEFASSRERQAIDTRTPRIRNIHLSHVTARDIRGAASGFLLGLPEMPIEDVTLDDVVLEASPELDPAAAEPVMSLNELPATGGEFFAEHVRRLRMRNVTLTGRSDTRLWLRHVEGANFDGLATPTGEVDDAAIRVEHGSAPEWRDRPAMTDGQSPATIDSHRRTRALDRLPLAGLTAVGENGVAPPFRPERRR